VEFAPGQIPGFMRGGGAGGGPRPQMGQMVDPIRLKSQRQNPIPSFEELQQQKIVKQQQQQKSHEDIQEKDSE